MTQTLDPGILREYDIRGIVGKTLTNGAAHAIGRAFGAIVARERAPTGAARICLGYDGRLSSPALAEALEAGLREAGAEVLVIGRGPTPLLYFAVHRLEADGGVMVTGSHNPPDYNGFKMMLGHGSFHGEQIQELGRLAQSPPPARQAGCTTHADLREAYVETLAAAYDGTREGAPTAVWDPGNGAAGEVLPALAHRLPGRHILINETVDGRFPAHHPDPTRPDTLVQLIQRVEAEGADLGIAFDGDGDRIGVVDAQGRILWGDQLMILFARDLLARQPGAVVIADVKASQSLFDDIAHAGGSPLMWRTGHSLIKRKMAETGALLAGEMSGHLFFADRYYGYDDALYAAVRLLGLLARSHTSLAALRDRLPHTLSTPELRFDCAEERKFAAIDEVRQRLAGENARFSDIDGVRVETPDGWWLLRASNTQPALVARCEGRDAEGLARLKQTLREKLEQCGLRPPDF